MGKKIDKTELVANVKALNKLGLTEDKISTKGDTDDILAAFMEAIEEIDDSNKIGEVTDEILDYYEGFVDDDEDEDEKPAKGKKDKGKKGKKAKDEDEEDDEDDEEESDDEDEESDDEDEEDEDEDEEEKPVKGKKGKKDTKKGKKGKGKKTKDEDEDEDEEDDEDEEEEKPKKGGKKGKVKEEKKGKKDKKEKKEKKGKKEKLEKDDSLPKGIKNGTMIAKLYKAIASNEEGVTLMKLAKLIAKDKDKDPEKCLNWAMRQVVRKIGKIVDINARISGGTEAKIVLSVAVDEDDD